MKKILLLHGWTNRRPSGHWLRETAAAMRSSGNQVWYPQFPEPDRPKATDWQELLRQEASMMDEVQGGEKIAIAHSLGTINWLFGAANNIFNKRFDRVLLVAIPDPALTSQADGIEGEAINFEAPELASQMQKWSNQTLAVSSDKDRWQPNGTHFYSQLGIRTEVIPGAGHFSLDDGWGRWRGLENWIESANPQDLMLR